MASRFLWMALGIALLLPAPAPFAQEAADPTNAAEDELFGDDGDLFGEDDGDLFGEADDGEDLFGSDEGEPAPQEDTAAEEPSETAPDTDEAQTEPPPASEVVPPPVVAPRQGIEEILIQSQRQAQSLIEAPMSVTEFDEEYLEAVGASDVTDLARFTPNLEIKAASESSNAAFFIRGVGLDDLRSNAAGAVAILNDDVYMASPVGQLSQLFDVEQVGVLRGPQAVLYGRNASAGAIRVVSKKPTGEFTAGGSFTYGNFDFIDTNGYVEVPIYDDVLSMRSSFRVAQRDGIVTNRCANPSGELPRPPNQQPNPEQTTCRGELGRFGGRNLTRKINDIDNWGARTLVRLQPNEDMDFILNIHGGANRSLAPRFQTVGKEKFTGTEVFRTKQPGYVDPDTCLQRGPPLVNNAGEIRRPGSCQISTHKPEDGDPYAGDYNSEDQERLDLFGTHLTSKFQLEDWRVESITGFENGDRNTGLDLDSSPRDRLESKADDNVWQVTQEVKGIWEPTGDFVLTVGAMYLHEDLNSKNTNINDTFNFLQNFDQITDYLGLYVYGQWDFAEDMTLEGGVRYHREEKLFDIQARAQPRFPGAGDESAPTRTGVSSSVLNEPTGELILRYEPTDEISFYGRYTRGFKGAHFNGGAQQEEALIDPVKPEFVDAYELGWKSRWIDGVFSLNGAVFYYDYENQQVFQIRNSETGPAVNELINAEDSRVAGVEADFTIAWEGLRWYNSGSYLFSEYSDFRDIRTTSSADPGGGGGAGPPEVQVNDFSGNRLVSSPEWNYVGFLSYDFDLGRFGRVTPRFDYTYRSEVFFSPRNNRRAGDNPLWLFHARLGYAHPSDHWDIAVWVRNITDEAYRITAFDLDVVNESFVYVMGDPRTYGLTFNVRF